MSFILPSIGGGIIASPTAPPAAFNTYSVKFDGSDDVMTASGTELDLKSNFSTSGWYNAPNPSSASGFVWYWGQNSSGKRRALLLISGQWNFNFYGTPAVTSTSTASANTWYHIVTTVNSDYSEGKIYVNGTLENTVDLSSHAQAYTTYSGTYLGDAPVGVGVADMLIDEFAIFNSVLSASDVTSIYNSGTPADLSSYSPVGWWRMGDNDGGTGTTITDQGSGGNDGTLTNGPTFSTTVP